MEKLPKLDLLKRRKALSGVASGLLGTSQLPSAWTKPLIDTVVLPTHAKTSPTCTNVSLVLPGISIPISIGCDTEVPDQKIYISYDIDDSDICSLKYTVGEEENRAPGRINIVIAHETEVDWWGGPVAYMNVSGFDCIVVHSVLWQEDFEGNCYKDVSMASGSLECTFVGATGKEFIAAVTFGDDRGERLFIDDIVLMPK